MFKEPIISIHNRFRMCKAMNGIVGIDDYGSSILNGLVFKLKIKKLIEILCDEFTGCQVIMMISTEADDK